MEASLTELHVYALSFRSLNREAAAELERAGFVDVAGARATMSSLLGRSVQQLGIVQKCNAVILVVVAADRHNAEFIRQRTLDCWDQTASGTILPILPKIRSYSGLDAAQFLVECAVGLHSLVTGDSQVLHQMMAMAPAGGDPRSTMLGRLAQTMKEVAKDVRTRTGLGDGELSAERLACTHLAAQLSDDGRILVVGSGNSADLVTKILAREQGRDVVVVNRTLETASSLASRRGASHQPLDAASSLDVSAVVFAVPRHNETVGFAEQMLTQLAARRPGLVVVDLSPQPLLGYDGFGVAALTLEEIVRQARQQMATRQAKVSRAHELIRTSLPALAKEVELRSNGAGPETVAPPPSAKADLIVARAAILRHVRDLLEQRGFAEITTPCVAEVPTDPPRIGGEGAFELDWVGGSRFLRQSNQPYKQMAIAAGAGRVYEIGPFWRHESLLTPRHLYESTGLDAEWRLEGSLDEVLELAHAVVAAAAAAVAGTARIPASGEIARISYADAVEELQSSNFAIAYGDDLAYDGIVQLASIVAQRHASDCFAITHFPDLLRRFYTQSLPGGLTATFDLVLDGWKIASGAVREIDVAAIIRKMQLSGLSPKQYEFYVSALESAPSHGGFGLGVDRLVARLLGKQSVLDVALFTR